MPALAGLLLGGGAVRLWDAGRIADLRVQVADLRAEHSEALRVKEADFRLIENGWRDRAAAAEKSHAEEVAAVAARRNPGPGAPVRVCAPGSGAGSAPGAATAGVPVDAAAAPGLVSGAVLEGADVGPMLRLIVKAGDDLAASCRAVLAERQSLVPR